MTEIRTASRQDKDTYPTELTGAARAGFRERNFIVFMAAVTSIVAFSVDMMLPALADIGSEYRLSDANDTQLVIIAFIFSFGVSQLFFGPLTDAFGRRKILVGSLFSFALISVAALFSPNFETLLLARALAGVAAGAARTASQAVVRDCFVSSDMARIMSLVMAVFMVAPLAAPVIGQFIIYLSNWHWIFLFLGIGGAITATIGALHLKETQDPENIRPLSAKRVSQAFLESLTYRRSTGYTLVSVAFTGALFTYVVMAPQVFGELYGLGGNFVYAFMAAAGALTVSSIVNGKLVKTVVLRKIVHLALIAFFIMAIIFVVLAYLDSIPFEVMLLITMSTMFLFGFVATNTSAIALEPMGHIAGTASSVINTVSVSGGALIGGIIGQLYDGTVVPMATGYLILAIIAIIAAFWGERGSLTLR
ncbi:Bcr/CflA family efflux MFS transporter [Lentilitoribacter sp. Alg239-R112]|uniref:Bcr/CflA family efflux MFS transporter n=1 Tax=Lentilitoribacter sp. Alg239-R112 TaxID=2305987 RepID=UPI0013A6C2D8|nr:Bcr/CflA family efflux MFS transporter [Lentilitoribacter sp. Alg239-R112]